MRIPAFFCKGCALRDTEAVLLIRNDKPERRKFDIFLDDGMCADTDLGIDLGTSNVLIYGRNRGIIFKAPAVIALNRDTNAVIAIGEDPIKCSAAPPEASSSNGR